MPRWFSSFIPHWNFSIRQLEGHSEAVEWKWAPSWKSLWVLEGRNGWVVGFSSHFRKPKDFSWFPSPLFSSFSSLLPRQFTNAGYFSDCKEAKGVCVSSVMWRLVQPLCRNFTCGLPLLCKRQTCWLDIHGSVHRGWFSRNTNKMQLCNRIYYSSVYWRLNVFRAAHRSSSGALNCVCSLWFIYPCGHRPLPRLSGK